MILIVKSFVAVAFLLAGSAKLFRAKPLAAQFDEFGLPSWTMPVVGLLEVAGAVGLFVGPLPFLASAGLALLMLGAVANHFKARHPMSKFGPALVLLLLSGYLAFLLRAA